MNPKKKKGGMFSLLERTSNYIFQLYESDLAWTTSEMVQSVKIKLSDAQKGKQVPKKRTLAAGLTGEFELGC